VAIGRPLLVPSRGTRALSGYVAVAIDNALLYRSEMEKAEELARLKEFSENIVESIHVGILAADLEGRVESWNSQVEKLTGVLRQDAVGRKLRELLPEDLCDQLAMSRNDEGVQNIYQYLMREREATLNIAAAPLTCCAGSRASAWAEGRVTAGNTCRGSTTATSFARCCGSSTARMSPAS